MGERLAGVAMIFCGFVAMSKAQTALAIAGLFAIAMGLWFLFSKKKG